MSTNGIIMNIDSFLLAITAGISNDPASVRSAVGLPSNLAWSVADVPPMLTTCGSPSHARLGAKSVMNLQFLCAADTIAMRIGVGMNQRGG